MLEAMAERRTRATPATLPSCVLWLVGVDGYCFMLKLLRGCCVEFEEGVETSFDEDVMQSKVCQSSLCSPYLHEH